jgi:Cu+-exporting ATPase
MKTLFKSVLSLGLTAALPLLAGGEDCEKACPASKAACPASGATAACCDAKSDKMVKVQYKVSGMTCAACEQKLTKALASIDGVNSPSACAESKMAKLAYDPKKVKEDQLIAAVNKAGFKVEAETIELKVDGMTSGGCSDKVSKKLASLKGVSDQKVCHEAKNAVVTFDPAKVSRKDIVAAIASTDFKVVE